MKRALLIVLLTLAAARALAQVLCLAIYPVAPPVGFGVQDTGLNSSGYYPFDVATSSAANWSVVAYGNAANAAYLNAFTESVTGNVTQYSTTQTSTAIQGVTLSVAHNASNNVSTQTLAQTGVGSAGCSTGELDLFLFPNSTASHSDPTYPSAFLPYVQNPTLDQLTGIMITGTLTLTGQSTIATPGACVVNQSALLYSITFDNVFSGQTLFYQLEFDFFCYHGTDASYNAFCDAQVPSMNYFFTGSGGQWGIDDPLTSYVNPNTGQNYALLTSSTPLPLTLNLYPRIAYLIKNGQYGLDTNLSHWRFTSFYYGQHTWGSASLSSTWSSTNFSPALVP